MATVVGDGGVTCRGRCDVFYAFLLVRRNFRALRTRFSNIRMDHS
jgi:hypothetical protein